MRETFTVRKQSFGVGVERTFPVHSPKIERIEVAARGDVRRAKLYYLRDRVGRASRVRERRWTGRRGGHEPGLVEAGAMPPDDAPRPGEEELGEQVAAADADGAPEGGDAPEAAEAADAPAPEAEAAADAEPAAEADEAAAEEPTPATSRPRTSRPTTRPPRRAGGRDGRGEEQGEEPAHSLVELVMIVAVALGLALGIQAFLVKPFRIPSESMVPTLEVGQRVLVDRVSFRFSDPDRGDIVVFKPPAGADSQRAGSSTRATSPARRRRPQRSDTNFIKRVVAVPGDRLKVIEGSVYINGKRQKEPFARLDPNAAPATCPGRSRSPRATTT